LCGGAQALGLVLAARPDVIGHNLETVPRLYPRVRPQADYRRSRQLLERAAHWARAQDGGGSDGRRPLVKTGIMVGLGEQPSEVEELLADCADAGVDVLTIGQYVPPTEFAAWERRGAALGLRVHAAPFVRSSYRAGELFARSAQSYGSA
jgi:lipoic acid synthetase